METTLHFDKRRSARGFSQRYIDLLNLHGEYIEQKGGSYVLRLDRRAADEIRRSLAKRDARLLQEARRLKRLLKKEPLDGTASLAIARLKRHLDEVFKELKEIARSSDAVKPGYAVFSRGEKDAKLYAVTVAPLYRKVFGYKSIKC